jgi:bacteriorhodopsin
MASSFLALYTAFAFLTAGVFAVLTYTGIVRRKLGLIHTVISLWTGIITLNHFLGFFGPELTMIVDWAVTTPLLVWALGITVGYPRMPLQRPKIWAATVLQLGVIYTGYLTLKTGQEFWFWIGGFLMIAVFLLIFTAAKRRFDKVVVILFFTLWTAYPVLFYLGVMNTAIAKEAAIDSIYVVAVFSKQIFGYIDLLLLDKT